MEGTEASKNVCWSTRPGLELYLYLNRYKTLGKTFYGAQFPHLAIGANITNVQGHCEGLMQKNNARGKLPQCLAHTEESIDACSFCRIFSRSFRRIPQSPHTSHTHTRTRARSQLHITHVYVSRDFLLYPGNQMEGASCFGETLLWQTRRIWTPKCGISGAVVWM